MQKIFLISVVFILGFILCYVTRCEQKPVLPQEPLKAKIEYIKKEIVKRDTIIKVKEIERVRYIKKWHGIKRIIPRDSIIYVCDSVIKIDSTQIVRLTELNALKDTVIATQDLVIKSDSVAIVGLKKQVKKHKRQKKLIAVGLGALLGAALILR